MNGCTLRYVMKKPIVAPKRHADHQHDGHDQPRVQPRPRSSAADTTVVSATTPPTDRSMPPDRMTNVIPMALISRNGVGPEDVQEHLRVAHARRSPGAVRVGEQEQGDVAASGSEPPVAPEPRRRRALTSGGLLRGGRRGRGCQSRTWTENSRMTDDHHEALDREQGARRDAHAHTSRS